MESNYLKQVKQKEKEWLERTRSRLENEKDPQEDRPVSQKEDLQKEEPKPDPLPVNQKEENSTPDARKIAINQMLKQLEDENE